MTPLDEARALLARQQERERECAERAEQHNEMPCRPVLDMPPALLAALCDEIAALRAERDARSRRPAAGSPAPTHPGGRATRLGNNRAHGPRRRRGCAGEGRGMMDASELDCRQCRLLIAAGELPAQCGDCGAHLSRARARTVPPHALRDLPALASRAAIRAIDLDPASKLRGGDDSLDAAVRAERTATHARLAEARLAALRAHGPEGERFARALWIAYGARGPAVNERESLAALIAAECLRFEPGDWAVVAQERARVNARAQERRVKLPDPLRVVATILGNAILGAAVAAYDLDAWEDWRPRAAADPGAEKPARLRRLEEWRARFDARPHKTA